jgi:hypothetical protein
MGEKRKLYKVLVGNSEGKRPLRRPRYSVLWSLRLTNADTHSARNLDMCYIYCVQQIVCNTETRPGPPIWNYSVFSTVGFQ